MSNNKWAWIVGALPVVIQAAALLLDPSFTLSFSMALALTLKP